MKEKPTLQEKLAKRKYKIPNPVIFGLYRFIMGNLVMPKYKPEIRVIDDINDCDGPCFLVWNHLSRIDHAYLMKAAYPRRINIVAGYVEFFRSHLAAVFRLNQILPKKNFATDLRGMKAMDQILKQGGCVCFSPEGMSSIYGTNQPIVAGTGRFLKHYGVPVYFMEMRGQYLTSTKICLDERYGKTYGELKILFTKEDLERLSADEIEEKMNLAFRHDEYAWQKEQRIRWKRKKGAGMCKQLDTMLYRCPRCGAEMTVRADGDRIFCEACGNGATMDEYYEFHPFDETSVIPESPSKWVELQRVQMIRAIRKDPAFSVSEEVDFGIVPTDHLMKHQQCAELAGSGVFTVDHEGLHYRGTRLGAEFSVDWSYRQIFSLTIETDTTRFALYLDGEFVEFYPKRPSVGRLILATEEMHRLHVNTWKNFPWNDWMYEGVEER